MFSTKASAAALSSSTQSYGIMPIRIFRALFYRYGRAGGGQIQNWSKHRAFQPRKIAVLTPYLSDSLRYALAHRLNQAGIAARSLRPSRSLFSEPSARCLITLARLAHPQWSGLPTQADFRTMLLQVIGGIDLVRADLFSRILYRPNKPDAPLFNFDEVEPGQQERMTFSFGQRYTELRNWLTVYQDQPETDELDVFLSRLFGELISQPGFGFHEDFEAAGITAQLIESVQKFRRVTDASLSGAAETGAAYLRTVRDGVIAAQYLLPYQQNVDAVLLAPAYTFFNGQSACARPILAGRRQRGAGGSVYTSR
jgi:hypothetical protein